MEKLRIFVASPSDMAAERAQVEAIASDLKPLADDSNIVLDVCYSRFVVPGMGRPQKVIFKQFKPTSWDIFIGILWRHFGTPPGASDPQTKNEYLSGTEEEFKTAYRLRKRHGRPYIMMYRCTRTVSPDEHDPEQYQRVEDFFNQFDADGKHPGLYRCFETLESFTGLLRFDLQTRLLNYRESLRCRPTPHGVGEKSRRAILDDFPRRMPFFGRKQEMDTIMRALSSQELAWGVIIHGFAGIGKTTLAIEAAYRCKKRGMFDAFIFVSARQNILSPKGIRKHTPVASTLDDFLNESARLLQAPDITKLSGDKKTGDKKRRALFDVLCETRALLVYDNLETLGDSGQEALADFLRELLPSTCKAIITSRHPPDGEGAVRVELNRLKPKDAYAIIRSKMKDDSQLANKLRRVNESRWRDLYNEIEGLPLALIYTLGLMRARPTLTFDSALELLHANRNPDLLTFLFQTAQELFTRNDEFAVRLLSFFTPSATLEIWTEVAGIKPEAEMEATADRLAKLALVDIVDGQQGERRFALHPLARNYVQSKLLADAQAAREMGMRFAGYWLKYAKEHGSSDEAYKAYDLLDAEWSNLNEAEEWLWQMAAPRDGVTGDREAAGMLNELAAALSQFLLFCGRWDERIQLSSRAYEVMCALSNWREAGWRACEVAWIHCQRPADLKAASDWAEHCKEALAKGGGKSEEALGMQMRGFVLMMLKDYANAESLYLDALKIYSDLNKNESKASLLNYLGELNRKRGARGDYKRAKDYYSKALDLYRRMNLTQPMLTVTTNLGILAITHKPWKDARRWFKQALPLARQVRRQDLIAVNFEWLARFYEKKRNFKRAQELALEAQTIYEQLQHSHLARTQELVKKLKKKVRKQSR